MIPSNDIELYADFQAIFKKAIDYVLKKTLEEYKKDIDRIVYGAGTPIQYQRTYEFRESWDTESEEIDRGAMGDLYQDVDKMRYNPELGQHGSFENDLRDVLASMLFGGYGAQDRWYNAPRDAWEPLIEKLDGGKLDKWFREGMKLSGIKNLRRI